MAFEKNLKNAYIGKYIREPGNDTKAYYPLSSETTVNDMKGSGTLYNLTNLGNVTFGMYQGVDCAIFNGTSNSQLYNTNISYKAYPTQTVAIWMYISTTTNNFQAIYHIGTVVKTGKLGSWYNGQYGLSLSSWAGGYESYKAGDISGGWHLLVNTTEGTSSNQYLDGVRYQSYTNGLSGEQTGLYIGRSQQNTNEPLTGGLSELIIENTARNSEEIKRYYDKAKTKYGL